jgi:hypothetical protein
MDPDPIFDSNSDSQSSILPDDSASQFLPPTPASSGIVKKSVNSTTLVVTAANVIELSDLVQQGVDPSYLGH